MTSIQPINFVYLWPGLFQGEKDFFSVCCMAKINHLLVPPTSKQFAFACTAETHSAWSTASPTFSHKTRQRLCSPPQQQQQQQACRANITLPSTGGCVGEKSKEALPSISTQPKHRCCSHVSQDHLPPMSKELGPVMLQKGLGVH